MNLIKVFADATHKYNKGELIGLDATSLFEHYQAEMYDDAWTDPTEFDQSQNGWKYVW